ncbi:gastrula zinc finger protein XlCGF7.1-like isoform X2 [Myxocyprinus asiaticus]|uniref:gastrula zinc finger protein XlCGF7.1-like isoform X2 n=1 Tax=Myxocyprinus asiaticus TaxID=70543 RepID=UPI00222299C6|nr:gastrula zinc finger protein XlCGF7.1-like isoform X2 [Myxocyprinus asiaticus]
MTKACFQLSGEKSLRLIKEESADMSDPEACRMNHENTEEQTDLMEVKELNELEKKRKYQEPGLSNGETYFIFFQTENNFSQKKTEAKNHNTCTQCGKSFKKRRSLRNHMITHTGERPFKCTQCGKSFAHKSSLQFHIKAHTGEKPFTCHQCGKSFTCNENLKKHVKTHTGEKPYICPHCGRAVASKGNLVKHIRTHTGEKPYTCPQCGKSFTLQEHLKRHIRIHTGENKILTLAEPDREALDGAFGTCEAEYR